MKKTAFITAKIIVWILGTFIIARIFVMPDQPFLADTAIDDCYVEYTPALCAGDVFSQTFRLSYEELESIAIAFAYEQAPTENSSVLIQLYRNDILLAEQPLPLSACPNGEFLNLGFGAKDFTDATLTVTVTNTSEDSETAFSLLTTTDSARYLDYTDGYTFNGIEQTGSIFCRFCYSAYRTDYDFYQKLTKTFLTLLATILLSGAIGRMDAWRQQRILRLHE